MAIQANEYETRAQAWAEKFGVRMSLVFTGHRKYFQDDKDTRDTYSVTLTRDNRSMTFDFGASLVDSKAESVSDGPYWKRDRLRSIKPYTPYYKYPNMRRVATSLYDVVACLEKYDPGTFEQWAGEFGYDVDSRKALETYLVVQKQYQQFAALCAGSPEMMSEAQEIQ